MFGSLGSSSRCSRRAFLRNFTQSRFSSGARRLNSGNESHMDIALTWIDVSRWPCFARSSEVDIFNFRNKFGLPALCCPEMSGVEAEPQVPNPLAMLPPLAWSVKPLIFSWNSRTLWDDFLWSWELLGLLKLLSLSFICTVMGSPGQGMMFWCFDTMILLSLSAWQDDCGMATGKSSEAFGVLPDHGFPLGNQTIQIIQAMEM